MCSWSYSFCCGRDRVQQKNCKPILFRPILLTNDYLDKRNWELCLEQDKKMLHFLILSGR